MADIDSTLNERGKTHGNFVDTATLSQSLKCNIQEYLLLNDKVLLDYQQEALEMVMHKVARIVCGDAMFLDSWRDCIGYLTLVTQEMAKDKNTTDIK